MKAGRTDTEFCAGAAMACQCLTWLTGYLSRLMTHDTSATPDFVVPQHRYGERSGTLGDRIVKGGEETGYPQDCFACTGYGDIQTLPMGNELIQRLDISFS